MAQTYLVGDSVDETALAEFSKLLADAYDHGEQAGGSIDWNEIQAALDKAVLALGGPAQQFIADREVEGFDEEPVVSYPADASSEVRAAAQLLYAYRNPNDVEISEVDIAWELLLQASVDKGIKPGVM